jgi:hypothetical protein
MLGSRRFEVLGAWWEKSEGAAIVGLHQFVDSPSSSFLLFGLIFATATTFSLFQTLVLLVWLLYTPSNP